MHNMLCQTLGSSGNGTEAVFYLSTTAKAGITGCAEQLRTPCVCSSCFSDMRGFLKLDLQVF